MAHEELLIDADGHILEPPDLFERYLDPGYRARATRIRVGPDGFEFLEIDGKKAELTSSALLHSLGGMKKLRELGGKVSDFNAGRRKELYAKAQEKHAAFDSLNTGRREDTYLSGCAPGAMDMRERLEILNGEGMARSVIYPTLGLLWEAELFDVELAGAHCRAYNRWITDFCGESGGRLVPIAHLSLADPAEAARELERAVKAGCKGAFVAPYTITRKPHGHPDHDALFAAAQDLDVPLAIHPGLEPPLSVSISGSTGWAGPTGILISLPPRASATPSRPSSSTACLIAFRACAWSYSNRAPAGSATGWTAAMPSIGTPDSAARCSSRSRRPTTSSGNATFRRIPTSARSPR